MNTEKFEAASSTISPNQSKYFFGICVFSSFILNIRSILTFLHIHRTWWIHLERGTGYWCRLCRALFWLLYVHKWYVDSSRRSHKISTDYTNFLFRNFWQCFRLLNEEIGRQFLALWRIYDLKWKQKSK